MAFGPVKNLKATPLPFIGSPRTWALTRNLIATPLPQFVNGGNGPAPITGGFLMSPINPLPGTGGGGAFGYPIDSG
jgi:hypothetical protein